MAPLAGVRDAIRGVAPDRRHLRADLVAGLPGAIGSVPDGMAASALAGVNPVHGLYASFIGPIAGGLSSSSQLMVVTTTSAAALAAGSTLSGIPAGDRGGALLLLTALAGVAMVVAGVLHLGRYTRFVPHSVMVGLLTGVAVNIVCGQLVDLTGSEADADTAVGKAVQVVLHPRGIHVGSLLVGLAALALIVVLRRTPLGSLGTLVALVVPSIVVAVGNFTDVARVSDVGDIPRGLPVPAIPDLRYLTPSLIFGAAAIAVLVLVQGAGVAEGVPNPDGAPTRPDRDFVAQGVANAAAGAFGGQPVGGSVGQTALNVSSGARTRWGAISSGLWMGVILLALSWLVGEVAVPTLAAVLIAAASASLRPREVLAIMRTSPTSQVALLTTFIATLILPVTQAVALGVATSLMLQLNRDALDLRVVQLRPRDDGRFDEGPAPAALPSDDVTVLDVYGSLLYAGSRTLAVRLPEVGTAARPVVVLRLRGRTSLGATFFTVVARYAEEIERAGGRLYLSGADPVLVAQMDRYGGVARRASVEVFHAETTVGASTAAAVSDGKLWLVEQEVQA